MSSSPSQAASSGSTPCTFSRPPFGPDAAPAGRGNTLGAVGSDASPPGRPKAGTSAREKAAWPKSAAASSGRKPRLRRAPHDRDRERRARCAGAGRAPRRGVVARSPRSPRSRQGAVRRAAERVCPPGRAGAATLERRLTEKRIPVKAEPQLRQALGHSNPKSDDASDRRASPARPDAAEPAAITRSCCAAAHPVQPWPRGR